MNKKNIFFFFLGALGFALGVLAGITWMKKEAVNAGHAAWHDYQGTKFKREDFNTYTEWSKAGANAGFTWNYECGRFGPPPPLDRSMTHRGRSWLTPSEMEERKKIKESLEYQIGRTKERLEYEKAQLNSSKEYHKKSIQETERNIKEFERHLSELLEQRKND